jgi:tetratricopeptide (TPR) repeat protein
VLTRTASLNEAEEAYRALLPRASMLTLEGRAVAAIEAGLLAMKRGPSGLELAIPIFRQATRDAQDVAQTIAVLGLALALDRSGEREEARALLGERLRADPRPLLVGTRATEILGPLGKTELHALAALALETSDAASARAEWAKFASEAGDSPWIAHAKSHETSPRPAARGPR